jgi:hypothetical protein
VVPALDPLIAQSRAHFNVDSTGDTVISNTAIEDGDRVGEKSLIEPASTRRLVRMVADSHLQ